MRNKKNKNPKLEKFIHLLSWMELQEASEFQNCTVHVTEEKGEGFSRTKGLELTDHHRQRCSINRKQQ